MDKPYFPPAIYIYYAGSSLRVINTGLQFLDDVLRVRNECSLAYFGSNQNRAFLRVIFLRVNSQETQKCNSAGRVYNNTVNAKLDSTALDDRQRTNLQLHYQQYNRPHFSLSSTIYNLAKFLQYTLLMTVNNTQQYSRKLLKIF